MSQLKCAFNNQTIQVGDVLSIMCEGEAHLQSLQTTAVAVGKPAPDNILPDHTFVPLQIVRLDTGAYQLTFTSYRVGQQNIQVLIKEKDQLLAEVPAQFEVQTVIEKPDEVKEPVGPFAPMALSYPMWFWISLAVTALLLITIPSFVFYRKRKKQKVWKALRDQYPAEPEQEFFKMMRQLHRELRSNKNDYSDVREKLLKALVVYFSLHFEEVYSGRTTKSLVKKVENMILRKRQDLKMEFRILVHELQEKSEIQQMDVAKNLLDRTQKFVDGISIEISKRRRA